jgi:hypothetical protein
MTVTRPKTSIAIARTRTSESPYGGRQKRGSSPPVRSRMICTVYPSSATTCALESVVIIGCEYVCTAMSSCRVSNAYLNCAWLPRMLEPIMKCVACCD